MEYKTIPNLYQTNRGDSEYHFKLGATTLTSDHLLYTQNQPR